MAEFAITFAKATVIKTSCEYATGQVVTNTVRGETTRRSSGRFMRVIPVPELLSLARYGI